MNTIESIIEPSNKKQIKQYESYRKILNISSKSEEFVLKCLLSFDWRRQIVIQSITNIVLEDKMIRFRLVITAPNMTVNYVVSDPYREDSWNNIHSNLDSKMSYVYHILSRYCSKY